jgi:hypothetical protein
VLRGATWSRIEVEAVVGTTLRYSRKTSSHSVRCSVGYLAHEARNHTLGTNGEVLVVSKEHARDFRP